MVKMVGRLLWGLWLVLKYFAKAVWTGEVFPISPGAPIYDQGKEIGRLGGGKPQVIGKLLALPVLAVAGVGHRLGVLSAFVFMVLGAQLLVWLGVWEMAGENFVYVVYVAAGVLGIGVMIELAVIVYQRKVEGLRTILPRMFAGSEQTAEEYLAPRVQRDDDTLVVRIVAGLERLAGKMNKKAGQD